MPGCTRSSVIRHDSLGRTVRRKARESVQERDIPRVSLFTDSRFDSRALPLLHFAVDGRRPAGGGGRVVLGRATTDRARRDERDSADAADIRHAGMLAPTRRAGTYDAPYTAPPRGRGSISLAVAWRAARAGDLGPNAAMRVSTRGRSAATSDTAAVSVRRDAS